MAAKVKRRARPLGPKVKAEIRKLYAPKKGKRPSMRAIAEQLGIGPWQVYAAIHEEPK